jgi:hypothetical protein
MDKSCSLRAEIISFARAGKEPAAAEMVTGIAAGEDPGRKRNNREVFS